MERIKRIKETQSPELIDRVLQEVRKGLKERLVWLDHAFGRVQRLSREINGKNYRVPGIYVDKNDYLEVLPDSRIGNFSFFTIDDPQTMLWEPNVRGSLKAKYSLIFWFDLRKIPGAEHRNSERVKSDILKALNDLKLSCGRIDVEQIYEQAENIYKGFTIQEIDNQFLMHPFAGFRFTGILNINESC